MKELKDYLPFYIGCKVVGTYNDASGSIGYLTGITNGGYDCEIQFILEDGINVEEDPEQNDIKDVKPIFCRLSDITEEEAIQVAKLKGMLTASNGRMICNNERLAPDVFLFLLSKQIDLFGLIEAGLAIDATTLKQTEHAK